MVSSGSFMCKFWPQRQHCHSFQPFLECNVHLCEEQQFYKVANKSEMQKSLAAYSEKYSPKYYQLLNTCLFLSICA